MWFRRSALIIISQYSWSHPAVDEGERGGSSEKGDGYSIHGLWILDGHWMDGQPDRFASGTREVQALSFNGLPNIGM